MIFQKKQNTIVSELFRKYFEYSYPSNMYNNFNKTIDSEENKDQVNVMKDRLANLMEVIERTPTFEKIRNNRKHQEQKTLGTWLKFSNVYLSLIS